MLFCMEVKSMTGAVDHINMSGNNLIRNESCSNGIVEKKEKKE